LPIAEDDEDKTKFVLANGKIVESVGRTYASCGFGTESDTLFSLANQPGFFWGLAPTKNKIEFDQFEAYYLYSSNEAFSKPKYCLVR
jgi:hypothetical protein